MKNKYLLPLFAVIWVGTLQAQFVDYQVTPGSGSKNNEGVFIGQSFTSNVDADVLASLDIYINANALGTANFTLSLYATSGTAGNYTPSGNALYSSTFSNSILSDTIGTHYLFDDLGWSITGNTTYMVGIESESAASVKWKASLGSETGNLHAGATGHYRYVSGTGIVTGSHFAMTATTSAVPEPSTYAALVGGFFLAIAIYRRRQS